MYRRLQSRLNSFGDFEVATTKTKIMKWAADYAIAIELSRNLINLILDKFLQFLKTQGKHLYPTRLGFLGRFEAELLDIGVPDLEDPPPVGGGVLTDLRVEGAFRFKLFGLFNLKGDILFSLEDVSIDFSATTAGLPKALVLASTPTLKIKVTFPNTSWIIRWFLNGVVGPLVALGARLAINLVKKVEIPIWEIVDIFAVLGLRFAPGSPLLTAQKQQIPHSLLLASSFNLTGSSAGKPNQLTTFLPANTNIGAVLNERVAAAGVQLAFSKGWVPTRFRVNKWKIYINTIQIRFEQDKITATGSLKAKRGKCWCRVKVRITYRVAVEPKIEITPAGVPKAIFNYDANINTQISTSGMLVVIGAILLAPLFMSMTIVLSTLVNIVLNQLLPFSTQFNIQGLHLQVTVHSVNFSGLVPFQLNFPLQLSGKGEYDLSTFQQFALPPGNMPVQVQFTNDSISVQDEELRAAVELQ